MQPQGEPPPGENTAQLKNANQNLSNKPQNTYQCSDVGPFFVFVERIEKSKDRLHPRNPQYAFRLVVGLLIGGLRAKINRTQMMSIQCLSLAYL